MNVQKHSAENPTPAHMKKECSNKPNCMRMIQAILDGEATEEEKEHFRQNMDVCLPCIEEYHLEKCIRDSLCNKVERKNCPKEILDAIKLKLELA